MHRLAGRSQEAHPISVPSRWGGARFALAVLRNAQLFETREAQARAGLRNGVPILETASEWRPRLAVALGGLQYPR